MSGTALPSPGLPAWWQRPLRVVGSGAAEGWNRFLSALAGIPAWVRKMWKQYAAFGVALMLMSAATVVHHRLAVGGAFVLVVAAGVWLEDAARRARVVGGGGSRALLALILTALGVVLMSFDTNYLGFFVGLAVAVTSLGALVSECRQWRSPLPVTVVLFGLAVVAVVLFGLLTPGKSSLMLLLGGLLAGEIATELVSERSHRWSGDVANRRLWVASGVGVGLVALSWLLFVHFPGDMDPLHGLILIGVIGALVWMASSESDSLFLVIVAAVALIWASAPDGVAWKSTVLPERGKPYFLVLGDSYISGEGATRFIEETNNPQGDSEDHIEECRRADTAWPVLVAEANRKFLLEAEPGGEPRRTAVSRVSFQACSGAQTEDLNTHPRMGDDGPAGPAQLEVFERQGQDLGPPAFAVVSIGGNDTGFGRIGSSCVGPGSCDEIAQQFLVPPEEHRPEDTGSVPPCDATRSQECTPAGLEALAGIEDDLDRAYGRIRDSLDRVSDAHGSERTVPVITVPYPIPLKTEGACSGVLLDMPERGFLTKFIGELNDLIKAVSARHGFLYMDTMEHALKIYGVQLCDSSGLRAGLNFFAFHPKAGTERDRLVPSNWIHNSLHPNAAGHQAMARAAAEWFNEHEPLVASNPASVDHRVRTLAELYAPRPAPAQCDSPRERRCQLDENGWLFDQVRTAFRGAVFPLAFLTIGWWLALVRVRRWGRERELSLAKVFRCVTRAPSPNPGGSVTGPADC